MSWIENHGFCFALHWLHKILIKVDEVDGIMSKMTVKAVQRPAFKEHLVT